MSDKNKLCKLTIIADVFGMQAQAPGGGGPPGTWMGPQSPIVPPPILPRPKRM
jgi:hypothetical protein